MDFSSYTFVPVDSSESENSLSSTSSTPASSPTPESSTGRNSSIKIRMTSSNRWEVCIRVPSPMFTQYQAYDFPNQVLRREPFKRPPFIGPTGKQYSQTQREKKQTFLDEDVCISDPILSNVGSRFSEIPYIIPPPHFLSPHAIKKVVKKKGEVGYLIQ